MKPYLIILFFVFLGCSSEKETPLQENVDSTSLLDNHTKAKSILDEMGVAGGYSDNDTISQLNLDFGGKVYALFQGNGADSLSKELPRDGSVVLDVENGDYYYESTTKWPYFENISKGMKRNDSLFAFNSFSKTYSISSTSEDNNVWIKRIPFLLFLEMNKNLTSLRYIGNATLNGRSQKILSVVVSEKLVRLYIDSSNHLLHKITFLEHFSDLGDSEVEIVYDSYIDYKGIKLAANIKRYEKEFIVFDYSLKTGNELSIDGNSKLSGYSLMNNQIQDSSTNQMKLVEINDHIFMVKNIGNRDYNSVFMDFGDYLVALEAPLGDWASKLAIAEIRKKYPTKPIKYVVITHFHGDHSGGAVEYIKEGATVIAPENSKAYFEGLINATHSLVGEKTTDTLNPKFSIVDNKLLTLSTDNFDLIIKDVGPNAHVNNILVAYSPQFKFLFQGDLFRVPEENADPEPARKEALQFYDIVKSEGWEIDYLTGTHGHIGSLKDLEEMKKQADR